MGFRTQSNGNVFTLTRVRIFSQKTELGSPGRFFVYLPSNAKLLVAAAEEKWHVSAAAP